MFRIKSLKSVHVNYSLVVVAAPFSSREAMEEISMPLSWGFSDWPAAAAAGSAPAGNFICFQTKNATTPVREPCN